MKGNERITDELAIAKGNLHFRFVRKILKTSTIRFTLGEIASLSIYQSNVYLNYLTNTTT